MSNCAHCRNPLPADAVFCPECRTRVPETPAARPESDAAGMRTFSGLDTVAPPRQREMTRLEPGSIFAGRYEIRREIGAGGMGVVYLARDRHTGEELVLKLIHPDLVDGEQGVARLMAEGLMARQIRHPRIVAVYDVAQHDGQPYFTMEFVPGGTLRTWMTTHFASGRDVPLATAVGLVKEMLAGIAEAHRMGVVHRDLKPENVLLAGDPDAGDFNIKILDFGIARAVKSTRPGRPGPLGTPLYMAPEQMTAPETVGPAADIYSLSVMLYELLMEAPPQGRWEAVSRSRTDVPPAIDTVIDKGLSVRPKRRYASAAEFGKALDDALAGAGSTAGGTSPDGPPGAHVGPRSGGDQPEPRQPEPPPPPPPEPPLPRPPEPPPPPPPTPPPVPPPPPQGAWARLSTRAKVAIYAVSAFVILGIVGNLIGEDPPLDSDGDGVVDRADDCPAMSGPATNRGCPVEEVADVRPKASGAQGDTGMVTPPPPPPVVERWRDDSGNVFMVERRGTSFAGAANNVTVNGVFYGNVRIQGVVSPAGGNIIISNPLGVVYQSPVGAAVPGTAPGSTDALFGTVRFHINH